jgi:hypothetical protein
MGSCILTFDEMQILHKKSDTWHSDNNWLIVTWFVGPDHMRTDTVRLRNQAGSVALESGDTIRPASLPPVGCADGDLVTATFQVVNLGSTDSSSQEKAAGDIGKKISETVAEIYARAAEEVVRQGVPAGEVFAAGIEKVKPVIVSSVGTAWDDIILPLIEDRIGLLQQPAEVPSCNGDVLHDVIAFMPFEPKSPQTSITPPYAASSNSGCGSAASTSVVVTLDRVLDDPMGYGNFLSDDIETVPVQDGSPADWTGLWAENATARTPIIKVEIEPSRPHSGALRVTITERIDPRFGAEFDGGGGALFPHSHTVSRFWDDVFASVRPTFNETLKPGYLALRLGGTPTPPHLGPHLGPGPAPGGGAGAEELSVSRTWQRPTVTGPGLPVTATMLHPIAITIPGEGLSETVDTIEIPTQGILLCLYAIKQVKDERTIAYLLRYIRQENLLYTNADVMLGHWGAGP